MTNDINVRGLRILALRLSGIVSGDRLPKDFGIHPEFMRCGDRHMLVKVLTSDEARALRPKSRRPHRVMVWDVACEKWQYAGKYVQHCRMVHKEEN